MFLYIFFPVDLTKMKTPEPWLMLVGKMETGGSTFKMSQIPNVLLYF